MAQETFRGLGIQFHNISMFLYIRCLHANYHLTVLEIVSLKHVHLCKLVSQGFCALLRGITGLSTVTYEALSCFLYSQGKCSE